MRPASALPWERLRLERGCAGDYAVLAEHHYLAGRPLTVTRTLSYRERRVGVAGRYLSLRGGTRVVAVLIESAPRLFSGVRDWALRDRYRPVGRFGYRAAGALLCEEVRCVSRVVVHPQWRGVGLAVGLVRAALAEPVTIFTEAYAVMGHVHPFFEKAGMTAFRRSTDRHDARLADALASIDVGPVDLADVDRVFRRVMSRPARRRDLVLHELAVWHRERVDRSAGGGVSALTQLRDAQRRLMYQPIYYLHDNRGITEEGQG